MVNPTVTATAGGSTASLKINRPSWKSMIDNYPNESTKSNDFYPMVSEAWLKLATDEETAFSYANTCAGRMSYALNHSGFTLPKAPSVGGTMKGNDGLNYWLRVSDLIPYLKKKFGKGDVEFVFSTLVDPDESKFTQEIRDQRESEVYTNVLNKIANKKGIIVFEVSGWGNASGHFTLWDGTNLVYVGDLRHNDNTLLNYYFWYAEWRENSNGIIKAIQTTKIIWWELK